MSKKLYKVLYNIPLNGIYCLLDNRNKRVYITWSSDVPTSISRNIMKIRGRIHEVSDLNLKKYNKHLDFVFLEELKDRNMMQLQYHYWVEYYENLGYTVYRKNNVLKYRVRIDVLLTQVLVKLISRSYKEIIVGVFKTVQEANDFVDSVYKGMKIIRPVYSSNELTRNYCKNNR